jgi:HSP20 family protein
MIPAFFGDGVFSELDRMRRDIDALFNTGLTRGSIRGGMLSNAPLLSIGETSDDVRVYAFAPGLDVASIDVTLQGNLLRLSGKRKSPFNGDEIKGQTVHRSERRLSSFDRVVSLPESVDPNSVSATYTDGVLSLVIAKKPEVKPRKIEVIEGPGRTMH